MSVSIQYGSITAVTRINETQIRVGIGIGVGASPNCRYWWATANGTRFASKTEEASSQYLSGNVTLTVGPGGGTVNVSVRAYAQVYEGAEQSSGSVTYSKDYPAQSYTVTFDPGEGTVSETSRSADYGAALGTLPMPTPPEGYGFAGWYTAASGGEEVTAETLCSGEATYYAQYAPLAILHLVRDGTETTVSDIRVVHGGAAVPVLSVWSVENGVPRRGT